MNFLQNCPGSSDLTERKYWYVTFPMGITISGSNSQKDLHNWVALPLLLLWKYDIKIISGKLKLPNKDERFQGKKINEVYEPCIFIAPANELPRNSNKLMKCQYLTGSNTKWTKLQEHKNTLLLTNICPQYVRQLSHIIVTEAQQKEKKHQYSPTFSLFWKRKISKKKCQDKVLSTAQA